MNKSIACVVLAAGAGTRMKSKLPKVLHEVCGIPLLGHVLNTLEKMGLGQVLAVVGHEKEQVTGYVNQRAKVVEQIPPRGTGHALLQAKGPLGDFIGSILVVCGDAPLITADTLQELANAQRPSDIVCSILTFDNQQPSGYGRIVKNSDKHVIRIVEELNATDEQKRITEVNAGAYCFDAKELFWALEQVEPDAIKNEIYLTDAIEILAKKNRVVSVRVKNKNEALGINSRKDLSYVTQIKKQEILNLLMEQGVTIVDENTTFITEEVSIGSDTVIHPNTVIEGPVKIGVGCSIGPFARIRPGVEIADNAVIGNFVEINRSTIGEGSLIKHLSYIGDSQIGSKVNVGAGTITANFDGVNKNKTIIDDGAKIGSGTILVAPVEIGKQAITGAGTVLTKNTKVESGQIVVGVPGETLDKKKEK